VIKSQLILRIAGQNPHLFQRDVVKVVDAILDQIVSSSGRSGGVAGLWLVFREAAWRSRWAKSENRRYTARTRKNHFCFQAEQGKSQAAQLRWLTHQKRLFQNHRILCLLGMAVISFGGSSKEASNLPSRGFITPPKVLSHPSHRNE
jgi:hypothetical protein